MFTLIAGKDRSGKNRWTEWFNLVLCAAPIYLGILAAERIDGWWQSLLFVVAGFLIALLVLWWRGRSAGAKCWGDEDSVIRGRGIAPMMARRFSQVPNLI